MEKKASHSSSTPASPSSTTTTQLVGGIIKSLFTALVALAFLPVFLVLALTCTLSGIGPLLNWLGARKDKSLLEKTLSPSGPVVMVTLPGTSRRLAVRWSPGKDPALPPVCIPNGLGATLISIAGLHDELEARGYPVLSYDRAGVGQSDPRPESWGHHATAEQVVQDMKALIEMHVPTGTTKGRRQWVLIGPSMGSIVAQCYIAAYPEDVAGFMNVDGVPYPFAAKRDKFSQAGKVYEYASAMVWTGVPRFFIGMAAPFLKKIESKHFKVPVVAAQMKETNFTASLSKEMITMMDLTDYARKAWGPAFDLGAVEVEDMRALFNGKPAACGDMAVTTDATSSSPGAYVWEDLPRAAVEVDDDWAPWADTKRVVDKLHARATGDATSSTAVLPSAWPRLIVRVLSARNYDFGAGSDFYDSEMKAWAAAEHTLHAALAQDGKRLVFPKRSHQDMFFGLFPIMAAQVDEITAGISKSQGLPPPALSSSSSSSSSTFTDAGASRL